MSLDVLSDRGALLRRTFDGKEVPDIVKKAAGLNEATRAKLPETAFADEEGREFPIVDAGNALVSSLYFQDAVEKVAGGAPALPSARMQKIAAKLVAAHRLFGLPEITVFEKIAEAGIPEAVPVDSPQDDPEHLDRDMRHFVEKYAEFRPENRRDRCCGFLKRATDLKVEMVPQLVAHYGSANWNPEITGHLTLRYAMLKEAGKTGMLQVLEDLAKRAGADEVDPLAFADALHEFDKVAGLVEHYDTRVSDPFFATFGIPLDPDNIQEQVKEAVVKFASGPDAAAFSADLLKSLKEKPLETLEALPEHTRNAVLHCAGVG